MKNFISTLLILLTSLSLATSQSEDKWETWADNLAEKAERWAERFSEQAERSAEHLASAAEDIAADIEESFDRGDFDIHFNNDQHSQWHSTGYLGIHSDHISRAKAEKLGFKNKFGSYVSKVVKNSSADKAGLQPFDYIYGVEDQRTSNNQDLSDILADYESGEKVKLYFVRNGQEKTVNVELGNYDDFDWHEDNHNHAFLGVKPSSYEKRGDMDGVSVTVINNTAAEEMGLESGDVIKAINGYPILDWDDVTTVIDNLEPGDKIAVNVKRGDQQLTKNGNIKEKEHDSEYVISGKNDNWNWKDEDWGTVKGAFLGVYLEHVSEKKARALGFDNPYGSYVSGVIENTAAEKAGIQPFDYIYGVDEYRVGEEQNLGDILRKYEPGDEASVHFYRKGKKTNKQVIFRPRTEVNKSKKYKDKCEDPFFGIVEMDRESGQTGVRVRPVKNSTAMEMGLEEGDVVTYINGYQMYDWTDIGIAINMLSPGDNIKVDYLRDGSKKSGSNKILSYAKTKDCEDCDCDELGNKFMFIDPDISIVIPNRNRERHHNRHNTEPRIDVDDVNVAMEDVSESEVRNLGSKGIDMEISNDLRVDNVKLSPNPNIGMFELQFDLDSQGETMVKVYNPTGRAIYEYDLGRFSGDFSDYIDISQNGPGTYFLQISQNGKSFVRKVVLTTN